MREYKSKFGTALTAVFILTGCGGGGSDSSPAPIAVTPPPVTVTPPEPVQPPATSSAPARNILEAVTIKTAPLAKDDDNPLAASSLTGIAAKGIIGGARLVVFDALQPPESVGEDGALLLGEGVTNSDGTYSLSLQTTEDTSEYLAIGAFFEGATMLCDAPSGCFNGASFGEPMAVDESSQALWAIFPKPAPGEAAVANLNLFTHFQLFRMVGYAYEDQVENGEADAPITLQAAHFAPSSKFVSNAFGLETDRFHTVPYVDPTQPIGSSNLDAIKMGLLSAGYLEAEIQSQLFQNGENATLDDVITGSAIPFILPNLLFVLNEVDTENNPRLVSLEDMFEAAQQTAELNTATNNSLSLAIDFLTEQNALIDTLNFNARLEADGTYPEDRRPEEEPEPEPEAEPAPVPNPDTGSSANDRCQPAVSPNATDEIVLLSGYEGTAYSSVTVTSFDRETEVTRVRIEPGETPLYVIASTFRDMVWSIEGDTNRITGFVAARGQDQGEGPNFEGVGVVGLPQDKVAFIDYDCMPYATSTSSPRTARNTEARFERIFGREIDRAISSYTLSSVAIPSGEMISQTARNEIEADAIAAGQTHITADNGIIFSIESQTEFADQTDLFRFAHEGLATVPVNDVVSPMPVTTYDVFPAHAGLVQLLSSGKIEYRGFGNSYRVSYFIHETFPRFPAGLDGAHSVDFILGTGVELPGGDIGHSAVFSEETGECLIGLC